MQPSFPGLKTGLLTCVLFLSQISYGDLSEGRRCTQISFVPASGDRDSSLNATCEGAPAQIDGKAKVLTMDLEIFPSAGKSEKTKVTLTLNEMEAEEIKTYLSGKYKPLQEKVKSALSRLNPPLTDGGGFNILGINVDLVKPAVVDESKKFCHGELKKLPSASRLFSGQNPLPKDELERLIFILEDYRDQVNKDEKYASKENLELLEQTVANCKKGKIISAIAGNKIKALKAEIFNRPTPSAKIRKPPSGLR